MELVKTILGIKHSIFPPECVGAEQANPEVRVNKHKVSKVCSLPWIQWDEKHSILRQMGINIWFKEGEAGTEGPKIIGQDLHWIFLQACLCKEIYTDWIYYVMPVGLGNAIRVRIYQASQNHLQESRWKLTYRTKKHSSLRVGLPTAPMLFSEDNTLSCTIQFMMTCSLG